MTAPGEVVAALAPVAFAQNANDPVARQIFASPHEQQSHMILLSLIVVLSIVPMVLYMQEVRRRLGRRKTTRSSES